MDEVNYFVYNLRKTSPMPPSEVTGGISLHILTAHWLIPEKWNYADLRAPHWRLYWNREPGAFLLEKGKQIYLRPDQILLIPPETSFGVRSEKPALHLYVHFLTTPRSYHSGVQPLPVGPRRRTELLALTEGNPSANPWTITTLVAECLARLPETHWGEVAAPATDRLRPALKRIDSRLPGTVSVDSLARSASMNVNAFIRLFREHLDVTPARYIREKRIEAACLLLHHGDETIETIARVCGFCDRYHFTRVFTRARQISPATFRKQLTAQR